MDIIEFDYGYLVVEDDEAYEYVNSRIADGTLWEYISVLINNDLKPKEIVKDSSRLDSIESMLLNLTNAISTGASITPKPVEAEAKQTPKPVEPKKVKKAPVKGKGSKGFAAAAKRAAEFR